MKIWPIGSIVKVRGERVMITGYRRGEKDGYLAYAYLGVPFPGGYEKKESLILFGYDEPEEVVFEGYRDDLGEQHLEKLEQLHENAREADIRTINLIDRLYEKYLEEKNGEAQKS